MISSYNRNNNSRHTVYLQISIKVFNGNIKFVWVMTIDKSILLTCAITFIRKYRVHMYCPCLLHVEYFQTAEYKEPYIPSLLKCWYNSHTDILCAECVCSSHKVHKIGTHSVCPSICFISKTICCILMCLVLEDLANDFKFKFRMCWYNIFPALEYTKRETNFIFKNTGH